MLRVLLTGVFVLLSGCGPSSWEVSCERMTTNTFEPVEETALVDMSEYSDLLLEQTESEPGWVTIAKSTFTRGGRHSQSDLQSFAKAIGADRVVFSIKYAGSITNEKTETVLVPVQTNNPRRVDVYGDDGSYGSYRVSGTSTQYIPETYSRTTVSDQYLHHAVFQRREED